MDSYARAAEQVRVSDALLVTAGAGMGVDSGLPDFRGNEGFWRAYPPLAKIGISFSEMANPRWFQKDPELAWGFYGHRLELYRRTSPHPGFRSLLEIGRRMPSGYFVFTSNVDGQFQAAGFAEERIEECHGSIHHLQCTVPCCSKIWKVEETIVDVDQETFRARAPLPKCLSCGALARPNILMFGDWSWVEDRNRRQSSNLREWLRDVVARDSRLVIIEIGAGKSVPTVRVRSEQLTHSCNASLIRINPRDFEVPCATAVSLPFGSEEGIRGITSRL